ncbi:MAG: cytochrome c biogenesis protein CcdA, partial [Alphaproteobacteria bacterium]|nr:cytochrome c biogenesis protein CcdA [Alphaproteobacteria bacterium]
GMIGAFIIGLAFAFGWTPCIGPILASILALAATRDNLGDGVILLAVYASGLGIPFILAALGVGRYIEVSTSLKKYGGLINRLAGVLLVATGVLVLNGRLQSLAVYLLDWFPALATLG